MASNTAHPHNFSPHQPQQMHNAYQSPTTIQSTAQSSHSPCYNCGSNLHWAQYCPEPRRQIPAGLTNQKTRPANPKPSNKKGSKPVITRYAPPPGYVPPVAGPTPPPPPSPAVSYSQQPPYGPQSYAQPSAPVTSQQWQQSPQTYTPPTQWQQNPAVSALGQHQPPQSVYVNYGQSQSQYPTPTSSQQSVVQFHTPQHQYAVVHQKSNVYPPYNGIQRSPDQSPQNTYPPHGQYPSNPQYDQQQKQSQQSYPQSQTSQSAFQPYQPPPLTNYSRFQHSSINHTPHLRPSSQSFRNNQQNAHHSGHGHKAGRTKRFQLSPPDISSPHPPSPPHLFPIVPISTWKNGPTDRPLAATFQESDQQKPISPDKGKNLLGSKYFDIEGMPHNHEKLGQIGAIDKDPVWSSVRVEGTTQVQMDDYFHQMDICTQTWLSDLKKNLFKENKNIDKSISGPSEVAGELSNSRKPSSGESKKRNWDEYIVNQKNGQDLDRRPNKRRHDARNRRGNRNRHGNKSSINCRNIGHEIPLLNTQSHVAHPLPQRSIHPLPPKPLVGPLPHSSSTNTEAQLTPKPRRSASPENGQKNNSNYRQRDYSQTKQENGSEVKSGIRNVDIRHHGGAALDVYSHRW